MRAFLARQPLGITAQGDDDLAAHVQPGIVVEAQPLIFKAIAHEDERGGDVEMGFGGVHADQHVAAMREALRPGRTGDGQRRGRLRALGLLKADPLKPAAARTIGIARRREAEAVELAGDITRRDLMPLAAGVAALEQVVGEKFDMGAHRRGGEDGIGGPLGRQGGGQDEGEGGSREGQAFHQGRGLSGWEGWAGSEGWA